MLDDVHMTLCNVTGHYAKISAYKINNFKIIFLKTIVSQNIIPAIGSLLQLKKSQGGITKQVNDTITEKWLNKTRQTNERQFKII